MKKILIVISTMIILQGCSLKVIQMDPTPNININESDKSIALVLNERIKEKFEISENRGIKKAEVEGWRKSLRAGFNNAFSDYYSINEDANNADLVLILKRADIEFSPTSVATNVGVTSLETHITFNSQLKNNKGKVIERLAKTANSKGSITDPSHVTDNVETAVESMYELIAEDMFEQ